MLISPGYKKPGNGCGELHARPELRAERRPPEAERLQARRREPGPTTRSRAIEGRKKMPYTLFFECFR